MEQEPPPKYTDTPSQPPPPYPLYQQPAQQPYPPQPSMQQTTVTTTIRQPRVVQQQVGLGDYPVQATCPRGHTVTTKIHRETSSQQWALALILCVLLGPLCALIPFCITDIEDVVHTCPIDGTVIGRKTGEC